MDNKVQALADKIYEEGVRKATAEADSIIAAAKQEAAKIKENALREAQELADESKKKAEDVRTKADAEVRLACTQAISALHTEVADLLDGKIVDAEMDKAFADPNALYEVILTMAKNWAGGEQPIVKGADGDALTAYFAVKGKEVLARGLKVESVGGKPHSFEILPQDGSYKVVVSKEAFAEFFKEYLRPRLKSLLFAEEAK